MKMFRRGFALLFALLLVLGLTACKALPTRAEQFTALVRGNLDEIYRGRADEDYLKFTGSTAEDVAASYENSLSQEVTFFCGYFRISHPTEQMTAEITELYRQIYANASYTVGKAIRVDRSTYNVPVTIQPLNIMESVMEDHDKALAGFFSKYGGVNKADLSDEELAAYEADWAAAVISMVQGKLAHITFRDTETIDVRVVQSEDGTWQMNADDLLALDALILYRPHEYLN